MQSRQFSKGVVAPLAMSFLRYDFDEAVIGVDCQRDTDVSTVGVDIIITFWLIVLSLNISSAKTLVNSAKDFALAVQ